MTRDEALVHIAKLVAGRDKTEAQVRAALERKGCEGPDVDAVIERARALRYLDDARVAARFAADALEDGWVGEALLAKLVARGLDERVARVAVDEARSAASLDERAMAERLLAAKRVQGAKAARFLLSRGFSEDLVERLVGRAGADG